MRDWNRRVAERLANSGHDVDPDIVEELAQHAQAAYDSARAEGLETADADARVDALVASWVARGLHRRRRSAATVVEPPVAGGAWLGGLLSDVRYAVRLARRRPGPVVVAALTMALGIGAATTLFSITWGVLARPLPWPDPDTLVQVHETRAGAIRTFNRIFTNGTYLSWVEQPATIESLAAYTTRSVTLTGGVAPERVRIASATSSLFTVMRASPLRGALFTAADEPAGTVAVLSHDFWRRQFGADAGAIGRTVQFDGKSYVVTGVLPADFEFPDRETVAWVPYQVRPASTPDGGSWIQLFRAVARLKPGMTATQAAHEATARARGGPEPGVAVVAVFGTKGEPEVHVEPVLDAATADVRDALLVLLAAVGLLLVTATANVASVQLARAAARRREIAVRAAIGAGSARLARQMLVEGLVVGVLGGGGGVALALVLHRVLPSALPADFPRIDDIAVDWRVLAFAVALTVLAGLATGLAPALQARRLDLREGLAEDVAASGAGFSRTRTARTRAIIIAGQVAVACLLLVGASLMVRTFSAMLRVDRGYDPTGVLTATIAMPNGLFTPERRAAVVTRTLERLRALPDVEFAGSTNALPLVAGESMLAIKLPSIDGQPPRTINASSRVVTPGYFEAMRFRLRDGRAFTEQDTRTSMPVIVVNRAFADKYLGRGGVGRSLPLQLHDDMPDWHIAGIVENVIMRESLSAPPVPEIFVSALQVPDAFDRQPILVARTRGNPMQAAHTLRQLLAAEAPTAVLESVMTMDDRIMGSLARPRLYALVLTGFGAFALVIATLGLFGVLSYSVTQRSKELGVRAALGARPLQIVALVLREGLIICGIGIAAGLLMALAATRWMASFLYGVAQHDALTFVAVPAILGSIALIAILIPARRAARLDPLRVLRST